MECPWQDFHVAVLGCGYMGTAILQGLLSKIEKLGDPAIEYTAWVRSQRSLDALRDALAENQKHVTCVAGGDIIKSISSADIIILGFPPDQLYAVSDIAGLTDALRGKLIISLLAGVSYSKLSNVMQATTSPDLKPHIMRVIPSIGAKINDSVTLIAETTDAGPEEQKVTAWMFEQLGQIQWLPEILMDEATGTGAVCNALMMVAVDAIVDASVAEGMPRLAALKLAAACLHSSSGLLLNGGMTVESMKESMAIPSGITINGVLDLERGHVRSIVANAVTNAIKYTRKM
ncbi:MAG: hypothetical protein L6R41_007189 [Letrouitia leprolyta]|nr:MAG: hypothetical protein L6R41_007189 [Letrouitia leprolyta]